MGATGPQYSNGIGGGGGVAQGMLGVGVAIMMTISSSDRHEGGQVGQSEKISTIHREGAKSHTVIQGT